MYPGPVSAERALRERAPLPMKASDGRLVTWTPRGFAVERGQGEPEMMDRDEYIAEFARCSFRPMRVEELR